MVFYGASAGAVRGTIRDAALKFPGLALDEVTALASDLWHGAVFERRLAAIVLLQRNLDLLTVSPKNFSRAVENALVLSLLE